MLEITFSMTMLMLMMASNRLILTSQNNSIEVMIMDNLPADTEWRRVQTIMAIVEKQLT